ncbi:DNA-directed RNA polymerase I subunit RPA43 [Habropoda laboriosa]|uniref:DNA-directed RNA polymerase I subunit RPA43 n=1 Tax=Habropoda laboriosa TaxID=597456 RepID=A0A0L7QWV4_9HYME|nr:PREDICTED: myb-like protein X [Habropoda laboriosa]KOC63019.1 DNA-directed RNA polymerase I subunit RPA43 [Habropoda laboriosa]
MKFKKCTGITWSLLELAGLIEDEDSRVHFEKCRKHLGLHPFHLTNLNAALNEILSSNLNSYDNDLKGFLLAYKNPKLLTPLGEIFYDTCFIHVDIEADFYIFRPKVGYALKGIVNKKGLDHIGVLIHKTFNVSIPKPDDDENWSGDNLEIGQEVRFVITLLDFTGKLPFIRGVLNQSNYSHGCRLMETSINSRRLSSGDNIQNNVENSVNKISEKKSKHAKEHTFSAIDSENTFDDDIPQIKEEYIPQKSKKKFKQEEPIEDNKQWKEDKEHIKIKKESKESKPEIVKVECTYDEVIYNVSINYGYESNEELETSIVSKSKTKKKSKAQSSQSSIDEDNEKYVEHSSKQMLKKPSTSNFKGDCNEIKVEQLVENSDIEQATEESIHGSKDKINKKTSKRKNLNDSNNSAADFSINECIPISKSSSKKRLKKPKASVSEAEEIPVNVKTEELNGIDINETNNEIEESPKKRHRKRKYSVKLDTSENEVDGNINEMSVRKSSISDSEFISPNIKIKKEKVTSSENTEDENYVQKNNLLIKRDPELSPSSSNYEIKVEDENNTIKKKRKKHSKNEITGMREIKVKPDFKDVVIKVENPDDGDVSGNAFWEEDRKSLSNFNTPQKKCKTNLDDNINDNEEGIKSSKKDLKRKSADKEMYSVKVKEEELTIIDEMDNYSSSISLRSPEKSRKRKRSSSQMQLNTSQYEENTSDIEPNFDFWNVKVKTQRFTDS